MSDIQRPAMLSPAEVSDALRRTVLGQDEAIREVSVAVVKHLAGHSADNVLLIGNSGSGKTTLMQAVEQFLTSRKDFAGYSNVVRINANLLAEETGSRGQAVLERLYLNARRTVGRETLPAELLHRVARGIVFVDEVDKIRSHAGGESNPHGILAQESLLTLMENEDVEFRLPDSGARERVNTASILFVAGGAFEELYDAVLHRALLGKDAAPLKPVTVVSQTGEMREELPFHLRNYLRYDDIFAYGMTPQFISRFESVVVLNDLGEEELGKIFLEPERSIFRTSREYFARFGVDLQIARGALELIAWEASRQKRLGARALKDIWRKVVRDLEYEPERAGKQKDGKRVLTIDEEMVRGRTASSDGNHPPKAKKQ